jgi:hypothetical protein
MLRREGKGPNFFVVEAAMGFVAQAGLELEILLPQPPECWDYKCTPQCPV